MIKKVKFVSTFAHGAGIVDAVSAEKTISGKIVGLIVELPQLDGATTGTVTVKDSDLGTTIYTKSSLTENAKTAIYLDANNYPLALPVSSKVSVTITASNAQTATDGVCNTYLLVDTDLPIS